MTTYEDVIRTRVKTLETQGLSKEQIEAALEKMAQEELSRQVRAEESRNNLSGIVIGAIL